MKNKRVCVMCGKPLPYWAHKYCKECAIEARREWNRRYREKNKKVKKCKECGKEFIPSHYHYSYCSTECAEKSIKRQQREKAYIKYKINKSQWDSLSKKEQLKRMREFMLSRL